MQHDNRGSAHYHIGGIHIALDYPHSLPACSRLAGFSIFKHNPSPNSIPNSTPNSIPNSTQNPIPNSTPNFTPNSIPNSIPDINIEFRTTGQLPGGGPGTAPDDSPLTCLEDGTYFMRLKNNGLAEGEIRAKLSAQENKVICDVVGDISPGTLAFALWIIYAFYGLSKMRVPVHSSAVVCNKAAILFLGESGTGKSTQASLWLRHIAQTKALNDDSPIVCIDADGKVYAHGSPWSGKGRVYINESYPVAAFVRLEQSSRNHIERLNKLEAFAALFPSFPPQLTGFDHFEEIACNAISAIIGSVPVYKLSCRPFADSAILTHSTIFNSNLV